MKAMIAANDRAEHELGNHGIGIEPIDHRQDSFSEQGGALPLSYHGMIFAVAVVIISVLPVNAGAKQAAVPKRICQPLYFGLVMEGEGPPQHGPQKPCRHSLTERRPSPLASVPIMRRADGRHRLTTKGLPVDAHSPAIR